MGSAFSASGAAKAFAPVLSGVYKSPALTMLWSATPLGQSETLMKE